MSAQHKIEVANVKVAGSGWCKYETHQCYPFGMSVRLWFQKRFDLRDACGKQVEIGRCGACDQFQWGMISQMIGWCSDLCWLLHRASSPRVSQLYVIELQFCRDGHWLRIPWLRRLLIRDQQSFNTVNINISWLWEDLHMCDSGVFEGISSKPIDRHSFYPRLS